MFKYIIKRIGLSDCNNLGSCDHYLFLMNLILGIGGSYPRKQSVLRQWQHWKQNMDWISRCSSSILHI